MTSTYTTPKPSPGPWEHPNWARIEDRDGNLVCETIHGDMDAFQRMANARLIAAAPDLLAALDAIMAPGAWLHDADCRSAKEGMYGCDCGYLERIENARAAIAKTKKPLTPR